MKYSLISYPRFIVLVMLVGGIFLFNPSGLFFLNDDFIHLHLTSQGEWLQTNSMRPVCDFSMWFDHNLWKLNALGFHVTNLILHCLATFLVYLLSQKLQKKYFSNGGARSNAVFIAAVFFFYAFHSETIYWVIGRSASLGAIFFLTSAIFYLDRLKKTSLFLSVLFFIIGLFTYESIWVLPVVFAIISWMDVTHKLSGWRKERICVVLFFAVLIAGFILRQFLIHNIIAPYEGYRFLHFDMKGLMANYGKLIIRSFGYQSNDRLLMGAMFFLSILNFFLGFRHNRKLMTGLLLMWLISYVPYLSVGINTSNVEGERYLYLPSIFLCIIIGIGVTGLKANYKYIFSILLLGIHITFLYQSRKAYETASAVTRTTTEQLALLKDKDTIYIIQLPQGINGALMFRSGIEEANQLFGGGPAKVMVMSQYVGDYHFSKRTEFRSMEFNIPVNPVKEATLDFSTGTLVIYR